MSEKEQHLQKTEKPVTKTSKAGAGATPETSPAKEVGGREGPEPTRYGDWEKNGIISDF